MEEGGYTVRGFAPTGKASVELSKAGIETKTVDSFLESAGFGKTGVAQKELWIVDEAGMMGSRKMEKFLKAGRKARGQSRPHRGHQAVSEREPGEDFQRPAGACRGGEGGDT